MKKTLTVILSVFVCLILFGSVFAGPEEVRLIPVSKWNYKNVDGWGFYAKNGDYSWFAFILYNPTNTDYTISIPVDASVANATRHKIINTSYKKMINGSVDFFYAGYVKEYFTESFTLAKNSTCSVFMDIADIQAYSAQWDTDVAFTIQIGDKNKTVSMDIDGVLAYDAKNTTPPTVPVVNEGTPVLSTVSFCRNYNASNGQVTFAYALKNHSTQNIPVELATTLAAEGLSETPLITYTGCKSGSRSCMSRIDGGMFTLKAGETAEFYGSAVFDKKPSKTGFYILTSLRYTYNGKTLIPYLIGRASGTCSVEIPTQVPSATVTATATATATPKPTATAVPTSTPKPTATAVPTSTVRPTATATPVPAEKEALTTVRFCRDYKSSAKRVTFTYALRNDTAQNVRVELPETMEIEGVSAPAKITYNKCLSDGRTCLSRIRGGFITLEPGETAEISGRVPMSRQPAKSDYFIRTAVRYGDNGKTLPLYAADSCSVKSPAPAPTVAVTATATSTPKPTATATAAPAPAEDGALSTVRFCRDYRSASKRITFTYALQNNSDRNIRAELPKTMEIEGVSAPAKITYNKCLSAGKTCLSRISGGSITLKPGETAEISGRVPMSRQPAKSDFFIQTAVRYGDNGKTLPLYAADSCQASGTVGKSAPDMAEPVRYALQLTNDRETDLTILPGYVYIADEETGNYEGTALISALDEEITGNTDAVFTEGEPFVMPPFSRADVMIVPEAGPADRSVIWNYAINGDPQSTEAEPVFFETETGIEISE